jgi:hypothetical protein
MNKEDIVNVSNIVKLLFGVLLCVEIPTLKGFASCGIFPFSYPIKNG